ncbi:unnamed protein product [Prorocentrum cordatum]|uniref:DNA (cytosine-5-)-methyltransferase n=1 Tax=Prorocentrum cordatum TaxID=2364126 RepID=A0ABN9WI29_9DINO|nr:unnamed protein product [Polarella glacialis]
MELTRPRAGQRFWVLFDRTEGLWHERLCLHEYGTGVIVATADGDVYAEEFTDYEDLAVSGSQGGVPRRLYPRRRYHFDPGDLEEDSQLRVDAARQLARLLESGEYPAAPIPLLDAGDGAALATGGGSAPLDVVGGTPMPRSPMPKELDDAPRGTTWYLLTDAFGQRMHEQVTVGLNDRCVTDGRSGLLIRNGGTVPASAQLPPSAGDDDVRTLPAQYNPRGERTRSFLSARGAFTEETFDDFPVRGPRTIGWLMEAFHKGGQSPVLFELGGQCDHLNLPNSAAFEAISRRCQLWEERYAEKLKQVTEGPGAAAGAAAERYPFLGVTSGSTALASPSLAEYVAEKMGQECKILKERRKVFSAAYTFSTHFRDRPAWVWSSVRHECWLAWALLPTAVARLDIPWSSEVTSVDASLHGFGVTACQFESTSVGKVGRVSERCRFRGELRKCARPRDVLEDIEVPFSFLARGSDHDFLGTGAQTEFPEVPEWFAKDSPWCVIAARRWRRKEKILNLEVEAALWAARRISRDRRLGDHRHLILSDSMAWVCAATKGRGSLWILLRRCRELCALAIASGCRFVYRWIPSEWNSADAPSRRYDHASEHHAKYFYVSNPGGSDRPASRGGPAPLSAAVEAVIGDGVPHPAGLRRLAAAVPFAYGLPGLWEAAHGGEAGHGAAADDVGCDTCSSVCPPRGRSHRQPARGSPPPGARAGGERRGAPCAPGGQRSETAGAAGDAPVALDPDRKRGAGSHSAGGARLPSVGTGSGVGDPSDTGQVPDAPEMLLRRLMLRRAPTLDKDEWDVLLTSYIEHLYDSGATENAGGTTLAALAIAIALDLCDCGLPSPGFFAMLVFETCMRPSEALALQRFQLVPPAGDGMPGTKGRWAVLIRALELGRPGKTDDFDGSVSLDLPRHQLLVPGLEEIFSRRGERDPVFLFDYRSKAAVVATARRHEQERDARIGHCKVFLDIFAGTGPVGRFLRERGHGVIFFEKKLGPIRRTQVFATVTGWLRAGRARGFWVAAPCVTATRARQNGAAGMPPPLRSNEHLRGLLGLGERLK